MQVRRVIVSVGVAITCWCNHAYAGDPLNSSNRPSSATDATGDRKSSTDRLPNSARSDFNLVPIVGGSTDLGFGGGYFLGLARNKPGYAPYLWNIDSAGLVTFKYRAGDGFSVPYQDLYARLTVPRLFGSPLRLELRPSYTWERVSYFGMGNASSSAMPSNAGNDFFIYERAHPQFDVDVRLHIWGHLSGRTGFRYIQNIIRTHADSRLVEDQNGGSSAVRQLVGSTASHAVALLKYGLQWDNRNNESSTHKGSFDTLDVKLSPGPTSQFPYRYGEATLNLRTFVPLWEPRLTLALRFVCDLMFGNPPFYELARYDDTFAIGGSKGVRGVPAQRYYGKVKSFGSVELRIEALAFHAFGKPMVLGVIPFLDAGRVWADTHPHPELDGHGIGLKYGAGGGVSIQSGSAFVLRADVAGSPDANPVSGYFSAGQAF